MKILIDSPAFLPRIGGLEIGQGLLADMFTRLGHQVTVVTRTPSTSADGYPFRVLRQPAPLTLLRAVAGCDIFVQANVGLRGLWPLLIVRRPWAVSHHSWYCRSNGHVAWQDRFKRFLLRYAVASVSVSQAIADDLDTPSVVIPNAYRDHLFRLCPEVERTLDLIFVGRLVSDKGVDLLLRALAGLARAGMQPHLTVVGDGPELPNLRHLVSELEISALVEFIGTRTGPELVTLLNRHRILVVPSRYNEPFGVVALEGIACGCVVVGSRGGGLPEAIGPCGRTFPNGDVHGLTTTLADLLQEPESLAALRVGQADHLARHHSLPIAERYLAVFAAALGHHELSSAMGT